MKKIYVILTILLLSFVLVTPIKAAVINNTGDSVTIIKNGRYGDANQAQYRARIRVSRDGIGNYSPIYLYKEQIDKWVKENCYKSDYLAILRPLQCCQWQEQISYTGGTKKLECKDIKYIGAGYSKLPCIKGNISAYKLNPNYPVFNRFAYEAVCAYAPYKGIKPYALKGNTYTIEENSDDEVYCIHPGKKFKNKQKYYLDTSFDTSHCSNSGQGFDCGIAGIVEFGENNKYDYDVILFALRLWTAYKFAESGDGWWEDDGKSTTEKFFTKTAQAIIENNYTGQNDPGDGLSLIYGYNDAGKENIKKAFNLFKMAVNGQLSVINTRGSAIEGGTTDINLLEKETETIVINTGISSLLPKNVTLKVLKSGINAKLLSVSNGTITISITRTTETCKKITNAISVKVATSGGSSSRWTVKMYRPEGGSKYQNMVGFNDGRSGGSSSDTYYFNVTCAQTCKELKSTRILPTTCDSDNNKCDMPNYNIEGTEYISGEIHDPSMNEIIESANKGCVNAEKYNYTSQYLSPGNEYGKVYCREDITLSFPDKVTAVAGMTFKYNLPIKMTSTQQLISTVVKSSKECVSIIDIEKWEKEYEDTIKKLDEAIKYYDYWKGAYNNRNKVSCGKPYQAEQCSAEATKEVCQDSHGNVIKVPEGAECPKTYTSIGKDYHFTFYYRIACEIPGFGSPLYGSTTQLGTHSECLSGGMTPNMSSKIDELKMSIKKNAEEKYMKAKSSLKSLIEKQKTLLEYLKECNLTDEQLKTNILNNYKENLETSLKVEYEDDKYGKTVNTGSEIKTLNTTSTQYSSSNIENLNSYNHTEKKSYRKCDTSNENDIKCEKTTISVQTNILAQFVSNVQADFYQDTQYYVEAFTGEISTDFTNLKVYSKLDPHLYPVSWKRQNEADMISEQAYCEKIHFEYSNLGDKNRNDKIKLDKVTYDCIYKVIPVVPEPPKTICEIVLMNNEKKCITSKIIPEGVDPIDFCLKGCECEGNSCNPICEGENCDSNSNSKSKSVIYRSVDLSNLFPNNRKLTGNWKGKEKIVKEIEDNADKIFAGTPEYSFILTADNIKKIKTYNSNLENNYLNNSIAECNYDSETKIFNNCKSKFLTDMESNGYASEVNLGRSS